MSLAVAKTSARDRELLVTALIDWPSARMAGTIRVAAMSLPPISPHLIRAGSDLRRRPEPDDHR